MGRIDYETETMIAHALRGEGHDASEDGTGRGVPLVPVAYRTAGDGAVFEEGDVTAPLTTGTDPNANLISFDTTQITSPGNYSVPKPGDACHPLAAGAHPPAVAFDMRGREDQSRHTTWAVRRLTPRECARLMGFPDDYFSSARLNKPLADGNIYKMLGNSMAVNVMRWIGERIAAVEAIR